MTKSKLPLNVPTLSDGTVDMMTICNNPRTQSMRFQPAAAPLGTAKFGGLSQLKVYFAGSASFYICGGNNHEAVPFGVEDDQHILCVGGTRSGKGTSVLVSNAALWHGSLLMIDPKGENATVTARRRANGSAWCEGMGQQVYLLDPMRVAGRDDDPMDDLRARYNPLDSIDINSEGAIDQVNAIADALVPVENMSDPFWERSARHLIKSVILDVLTSDRFEPEQRNLVTVYSLLATGDREKKAFLEEIGADNPSTAHILLFERMASNPAFNGLIAAAGEQYGDMAKNAAKQYLGVIETVNRKLEFIESPSMQWALSASDFDLADLKKTPEGVSLYLCLPQRAMETHSGWLRMMVTLGVNTMERIKHKPVNGAPVLMLLDEFAGLRRMRVIETAIAQLAGYGVKMVFAVQNLPQLKDIYKDAWESFVGNCGIKMILSAEDHFTRDYVSKLIGDTEVIRNNRNHNRGKNSSQSTANMIGSSQTFSRGGGSSSGPGLFAFSTNRNYSSSDGYSDSVTKTITTGESSSYGETEAAHKRSLLNPDEVGRLCCPISDKSAAHYPGRILVLKRGNDPMALRRCNYFEGEYFEGKFDPHPDHPYPMTLAERAALNASELFDEVEFNPSPPLQLPTAKKWYQRLHDWFAKHVIPFIGIPLFLLLALLGAFDHWTANGWQVMVYTLFYWIFGEYMVGGLDQ